MPDPFDPLSYTDPAAYEEKRRREMAALGLPVLPIAPGRQQRPDVSPFGPGRGLPAPLLEGETPSQRTARLTPSIFEVAASAGPNEFITGPSSQTPSLEPAVASKGTPATASGLPFKNFNPQVQAWLQANPPGGRETPHQLLPALNNANQRPMPQMGRTFGFGLGETTPGAQQRIDQAIAGIQPTSTPGGLTASQKRLVAAAGQSPLRQAMESAFGTPAEKLAKGLAGVDTSRVTIGKNPETGMTTLTGKQSAVAQKPGQPSLAQVRAERLRNMKDKLADKRAKAAAEKAVKANPLLADAAGSKSAAVAGMKALAQAQEIDPTLKLAPMNVKMAIYEGGVREFETNKALKAEEKKIKEQQTFQEGLTDKQLKHQAGLTDKEIASRVKLAEEQSELQKALTGQEIGSREKIAAAAAAANEKEAEMRDKGFQKERDMKAWEAGVASWSAANGGLSPETPEELEEVRRLARTFGGSPQQSPLGQELAKELPQGNSGNFQFGNVPISKPIQSDPTPREAAKAVKRLESSLPESVREQIDEAISLQGKLDILKKNGYRPEDKVWRDVAAAHNGMLPPSKQEPSQLLPPKQRPAPPGYAEVKRPQDRRIGGFFGAMGIQKPFWME